MSRNYEKQRRGKYVDPGILPNFQYDGENTKILDSRRNSRRRNDVIAGNDRNERRNSNYAIDQVPSYFSPTDIHPAPLRKPGLSSLSRKKCAVPLINEESSGSDDKNRAMTRTSKNQLSRRHSRQLIFDDLFGNNDTNVLADARKNRRLDDFDEWIEYDENEDLAEDNDIERCLRLDDEIDEKDYEENEIDGEIDEETDVRERESSTTRGQRKMRTETLARGQRISSAGPLPRYHGRQKIDRGKSSERCCPRTVDRETTELRTEEDEDDEPEVRETATFPSRKSAGRSRKGEDLWFPPRNAIDNRYYSENLRTRRTPVKSAAQQESVRNTKCELCGRTSEKIPKTTSSRNASCRLQDSLYFIDDPIDEIFETPTNYQSKLRRSKESRLPSYEPDDKELTIDDRDDENDDEIGAIYKSNRGNKIRESMNARRIAVCQRSARREANGEK